MKILITGGTGFLGLNIRDNLRQYFPDDQVEGVGSKAFDLTDEFNTELMLAGYKPDVIVHAAGSVGGIGANRDNPGKFMFENLMMGIHILEKARLLKIPKVVMLGTVCAYPKHTPVPFKEEDIWYGYPEETNAPYGIAKKTLMRLGEAYVEQYGMDVVNLIPVNMYGPYDHFNTTTSHVIPALIMKIHEAIKNDDDWLPVWGTGKASREFLYAPDCVEAIAQAIKKDVGPEPINIGTGQEITIHDLVEEISVQMGYEGHFEWDTSKPDGQPRRCLNVDKAKTLLDWEAKTELKEGLKKTIEWYIDLEKLKEKETN